MTVSTLTAAELDRIEASAVADLDHAPSPDEEAWIGTARKLVAEVRRLRALVKRVAALGVETSTTLPFPDSRYLTSHCQFCGVNLLETDEAEERFKTLLGGLLTVTKDELAAREKKWKKARPRRHKANAEKG